MARWSPMTQTYAGPTLRALLTLAIVLVSVLTAALLGSGQYLLAGLLSLPVLGLIGLMVFVAAFGWRHDALFWALVISLFIASLVASFSRGRFTYLATVLLLVAIPFVAVSLLKGRRYSTHATVLLVMLLGYYSIGILSSLTGRSALLPAIYTGVLAIKPFVLVGLGAALVWSPRTERGFEAIVRWAWLPFLALAVLQWFAPSVYAAVLSDPEAVSDSNPFAPQYPRALGPFNHPSTMAAMAGAFAVFNIAYAILDQRRTLPHVLVSAAYLVVVVMTGQRQELAAALIMLPVVYALARWRPSFGTLVLVAGVSLLLVGGLLFAIIPDNVERELQNWGLLPGGGEQSARAVLYADSIRLANQYWPLGTGFGTFASVGSVRFDQSLFVQLGYGAFWWYTHRSFLFDSFWSRYIAEAGWIGFSLHVLFYAVAVRAAARWLREPVVLADPLLFRRVVLAVAGLILVVLISPTSNVLAEAHGSMFQLIYIGVAWRQIVAARARAHPRSAPKRPDGLSRLM